MKIKVVNQKDENENYTPDHRPRENNVVDSVSSAGC